MTAYDYGGTTPTMPPEWDFTDAKQFTACSNVQLMPYAEQCSYVEETPECGNEDTYIKFIYMLYCVLAPKSGFWMIMSSLLLLTFCFLMFNILAITADKFFCPALKVVSKAIGMSEHLAGVTILAFGNGSPDLFGVLSSLDDTSRTLFSDLIGASMYITCFIGSLVAMINPFQVSPNTLVRDNLFLLLGVFYTDYATQTDKAITKTEAILIFTIYITYLLVNVGDQLFLKYHLKALEKELSKRRFAAEDGMRNQINKLQSEATIELGRQAGKDVSRDDGDEEEEGPKDRNHRIFQDFFIFIIPIDGDDWKEASIFGKFLLIVQAPIVFILVLFIPIVDIEIPREGWCKLLNCSQIVFFPLTVSLLLFHDTEVFDCPMYLLTLIPTVPFSLFIFLATRTDRPPSYHLFWAFYTSIGSMAIIYTCANETVQCLYVLGLVTNLSTSFLGCTFLAWGNGIGDLVSNTQLSRYGYSKMALAATVGGPMFNSFFSMGITYIYQTIGSGLDAVEVNAGVLGDNGTIFMGMYLLCVMLWGVSTNFCIRRSIGYFNAILYGLYILYACLTEFEFVQSFSGGSRE